VSAVLESATTVSASAPGLGTPCSSFGPVKHKNIKKTTTKIPSLSHLRRPRFKFYFRPSIGRMSALYDTLVCRETVLSPFCLINRLLRVQTESVKRKKRSIGNKRHSSTSPERAWNAGGFKKKEKRKLMLWFVLMLSLRIVAGAPARCLE
jgi:hypothetical protein